MDEKKILETIEKIKRGESQKEELFELLGGKRLYDFLDEGIIKYALDSIIKTGKFHSMLQNTNGFDVLQGLHDRKIVGDLADFYSIKPEYVLALPKEEQKKLAESIGKNEPELAVLLQRLWATGIGTYASTTRKSDNHPLIMMKLNLDDMTNRMLIQEVHNQNPELGCTCDYDFENEKFSVILEGEGLYKAFETTNRQNKGNLQNGVEENNMYRDCLNKMIKEYEELIESCKANGIETAEYSQIIEKIRQALEIVEKDINFIRKTGEISKTEEPKNPGVFEGDNR